MANQYVPNRVVKYSIRFYVVFNSGYTFCFPIFDNGKGNRINSSETDRYTSQYIELRLVLNYFIKKILNLMTRRQIHFMQLMTHYPTKKKQIISRIYKYGNKSWNYSNNFYTKHRFTIKLLFFTDGQHILFSFLQRSLRSKIDSCEAESEIAKQIVVVLAYNKYC